ncbi:surface-adhesin E family protein [Dysgonomonas reticulitermitis]
MKYISFLFVSLFLLSGCRSLFQNKSKQEGWFNIVVTDGIEVFTDTTSIRFEGSVAYAREKRVYTTDKSRATYIEKIKKEYTKMGKPENADKWKDFNFCIYNCLYECTNKRFRVLSVEDYDSNGKLIQITPPKKPFVWLNVDTETVGDYTFFFVCDYRK